MTKALIRSVINMKRLSIWNLWNCRVLYIDALNYKMVHLCRNEVQRKQVTCLWHMNWRHEVGIRERWQTDGITYKGGNEIDLKDVLSIWWVRSRCWLCIMLPGNLLVPKLWEPYLFFSTHTDGGRGRVWVCRVQVLFLEQTAWVQLLFTLTSCITLGTFLCFSIFICKLGELAFLSYDGLLGELNVESILNNIQSIASPQSCEFIIILCSYYIYIYT